MSAVMNNYEYEPPLHPEGSPSSDPDDGIAGIQASRGHRKSKEREKAARKRDRDLQKLLLYEERESKHLRNTLQETVRRLEQEMERVDKAEAQIREVTVKAKASEMTHTAALADAARANEELRLYKIQFANIQTELERAQSEYNKMALLRDAAEDLAKQTKAEIRQLRTERQIEIARNEGRREGAEEGFTRGIEAGFEDGLDEGRIEERQNAIKAFDRMLANGNGINRSQIDEYFRSLPQRHGNSRPNRAGNNLSRSTYRSAGNGNDGALGQQPPPVIPDVAPIVDNLPIRAVVSPVLGSEVGRELNPPSRPRSLRSFHGDPLDPSNIPTSEDGRIGLPPPHEIDPNPAMSPASAGLTLEGSRMGRPGEDQFGFNDASSARRGYRTVPSPGLSAIPEGSNADATSPDIARRREIDARTPSQQWPPTTGEDWEQSGVDRPRSSLRRSDLEAAEQYFDQNARDEARSAVSRAGGSRAGRSVGRQTPLAGFDELPDDPISASINQQIRRNMGTSDDGRASPRSTRQREFSMIGTPQSRRSRAGTRFSNAGDEELPEITIAPPSRAPSFVGDRDSILSPDHTTRPVSVASQIRPRVASISRSPALNNIPHIPVSSPNVRPSDMGFFEPAGGELVQNEPFRGATPRARTPSIIGPPPGYDPGRSPAARSNRGLPAAEQIALPQSSGTFFVPMPSTTSSTSRRLSQVLQPTPRRAPARIPSPTSSSSGSPHVVMPQLPPDQRSARSRRMSASSASTLQENSLAGFGGPMAGVNRRSTLGGGSAINRRSVSSPVQPTYAAAPVPDDILYPAPVGGSQIGSGDRPKSILRNPRTPAGASFSLPHRASNAGFGGGATPGGSNLALGGAPNVPFPRSPSRSMMSAGQPAAYEAAPLDNGLEYPPPIVGPSRTPITNVQGLRAASPSFGNAMPRSPNSRFTGFPDEENAHPNGFFEPAHPVIPQNPGGQFSASPSFRGGVIPPSPACSAAGFLPTIDAETEHFGGPVFPASLGIPGPPSGVPHSLSLTQEWLTQPLPPSGATTQRNLPPSVAPSARSLNQQWHPSQHRLDGDEEDDLYDTSGLPGPQLGHSYGF